MVRFVLSSPLPAPLRARDLFRLARLLEQVIPKKSQGEIGVRFVSENEIRSMNHIYRGKNQATDVLSFEVHAPAFMHKIVERSLLAMGDLVVCPSFAKREAQRRGIAWREELLRLLAHGSLHLAGEDHETAKEEARMFAKQERMVASVVGLHHPLYAGTV